MDITEVNTRDAGLVDAFGRSFPYLRLSITDVCNFRCSYCLPDGYQCSVKKSFLSVDEIRRVVRVFSGLGVYKIRITGGEPTVRKDFAEIARVISSENGVSQLAFTTNGYRLKKNAKVWRDAGISKVNVSVDSLDARKFYTITGHDRLLEVRQGIDAALDAGFDSVKVNVVLLKGINDTEIGNFVDWVKSVPISIRFIELMQTGDNLSYFKKHHLSADIVKEQLIASGWSRKTRNYASGPAQEYSHEDYVGSIGLIAPYSKDFCKGCNRLRVTAVGDLRLCLFGEQGIGLRDLLQHDNQQEELKSLVINQLVYKCSSHFLIEGNTGVTSHFASIGG